MDDAADGAETGIVEGEKDERPWDLAMIKAFGKT